MKGMGNEAERIKELSQLIDRNITVDFLVYRPDEFEKRLEMGDHSSKLF